MAQLSFQGKTVQTSGELPDINTQAPQFTLVDHHLHEKTLDDFTGKIKLLSILPSLDTPVCAAQARKFNLKASHYPDTQILLISQDLPFAQSRFCQTEGVRDVLALSAFRSSFAKDYGVLLTESILKGLMARAVIIIDVHNIVRYTQLVDELTKEPDYDAALTALGAISA
ncbi:MAG: thiol peroxidase [Methylococcales bacterium]|nr:thiol peroxidase [Methylococcales bacterium]